MKILLVTLFAVATLFCGRAFGCSVSWWCGSTCTTEPSVLRYQNESIAIIGSLYTVADLQNAYSLWLAQINAVSYGLYTVTVSGSAANTADHNTMECSPGAIGCVTFDLTPTGRLYNFDIHMLTSGWDNYSWHAVLLHEVGHTVAMSHAHGVVCPECDLEEVPTMAVECGGSCGACYRSASLPYGATLSDLDIQELHRKYAGAVHNEPRDRSEDIPEDGGVPRGAFLIEISNFPNPFNPTTTITIVASADVSGVPYALSIVDVRGRAVFTHAGTLTSGRADLEWDGTSNTGARLPAGVYFVHLGARGRVASAKLMLLK